MDYKKGEFIENYTLNHDHPEDEEELKGGLSDMKKLFVSLMLMVLVTSVISSVIANEVGVGYDKGKLIRIGKELLI